MNYAVQKTPRSKTLIVHINRLKPYFGGIQGTQASAIQQADTVSGGQSGSTTTVVTYTAVSSGTGTATATDTATCRGTDKPLQTSMQHALYVHRRLHAHQSMSNPVLFP